ncbi:MAG: UDP-2,4-diacetamido-2,4,6-trideoxy-beta-L-altropyranose hydrolase [Methanobacteriaceae archaeon]|jgi:CMP-N-acetylneuraminic acid synthetase/spore coat polysaccharide biosynthesis predicted glycosyltransferase SpsG|nr:UDP-2,4-diacetamido-2,4,6-trideoxy-beta-L-altropyranose hydrolase [Candidatus Methanorudis spinitermitis]
MYKNNKIIVVIPARGGSKGIPRKNIRLLANKPLISYSIETALKSNYVDEVVVTTDDDEIKFIAEQFGASTIKRSDDLAKDDVPLDPVIYDAVKSIEKVARNRYNIIITVQPTSPLLKTETLEKVIKKFKNSQNIDNNSKNINDDIDTIISVVDDRHLSWGFNNESNSYYPLYEKRVNRQYLPKTFKETGGIFATKREFLKENSRLGKNVDLIEVSKHESIDIDNYEDWWVAEKLLNKKKVLIKTDASYKIGTGHIYRGLAIASKLANHDVLFLLDENKKLGIEIVENYNYPYQTHKNTNKKNEEYLLEKILDYNPDIVINDVLNTSSSYINSLKANSYFVINFEDIGEGSKYADIVFDALCEHQIPLKNLYSGHKYYILKDEFHYHDKKEINEEIKEILLTFGGTDPNDLTRKTLSALLKSSYKNKITVILGLGYKDKNGIKEEFSHSSKIEIFENVKNISEYMFRADLIFTSAGRTMYEIASLGVPCVCLCQNNRELTHLFGNAENGFINLGLGKNLSEKEIISTIERLLDDYNLRCEMNKRMLAIDLKYGFENMIKIVKEKYKEFMKNN